jgi:multidrug efflux pump subunit AcrB
MTAALLTSLALALTFTPALSLSLLRNKKTTDAMREAPAEDTHHEDGPVMRRVLHFHARVLTWSLNKPIALGLVCLVLIVGGYFAYQGLGSDLLPEMDEGAFILDYLTPAGTSLAETNRILTHVEQILHDTPEVEITSRRTGLQLGLAAVTEANTGDFSVRLKSKRSRAIDEVIADIRDQIKTSEPSLDVEFVQVLQDMIGDLSNSPEPIQIKLFTSDPTLLNQIGPEVQAAIQKIPGVVDTQNGVDNTISGPATNFNVDPVVAGRLGFTPTEVAEDATAILDGLPTNDPLIVNGHPYTIRVRLPEDSRSSFSAIENTVFNSASGHIASLGSLAQITQLPPQNEIRTENLQRLVVVSGRLEGSDLGGTMVKVQQAVAGLHLPSSVRIEYGGTYQEQQKSFHDLARVLLLALALVFGVLLAEFRNFSAPLAILTSSVLSITGVVLALLITNTNFNVASFMGLIMVIGIVAKNGILLLDADEKYRNEAETKRAADFGTTGVIPAHDPDHDPAKDAMLHAAQRRLRPIVMTAIAAVCGMLPLAFALGSGSQMLQPLAIAVIGGLFISVVLSLVVTPVIYYRLTRSRHTQTAS